MREIANREIAHIRNTNNTIDQIVSIWSYAAWEVYCNKLKKQRTKLSVLIPKLKEILPDIDIIYNAALFEALFDSENDIIFGTFHEQFLEFLVANTIFMACIKKEYPYPEFLSYVIRPEINRYFRAMFEETADSNKKLLATNLNEQYEHNLGYNTSNAISCRVHAAYHILRFDYPERNEFLNRALNIETHISVKLSLYFGAIKMGRLDDEQDFFDLLSSNTDYNLANRGYHLAYYDDSIMGDELPFSDDGIVGWGGTLRAFIRHFESHRKEHYFLRRIDLITILHLIEARKKVDPITPEILDRLEYLTNNPEIKDLGEFQKKIEEMFEIVKKRWIELSSKE